MLQNDNLKTAFCDGGFTTLQKRLVVYKTSLNPTDPNVGGESKFYKDYINHIKIAALYCRNFTVKILAIKRKKLTI